MMYSKPEEQPVQREDGHSFGRDVSMKRVSLIDYLTWCREDFGGCGKS